MPLNQQEGDRIKISVDPDLETLIPAFLQHRREEIQLLRTALEKSDYAEIKSLGHTIKGTAGGYGFKGLSTIAARIELAAIARNSQEIQIEIGTLTDYLDRADVVYECVPDEPLVVCVDDEPNMLRLLERTLTHNGFRMKGSLGGTHALTLIQKYKPDVILMDIKMPGLSGYDMCARLHESADVANIPVLFITGLEEAGEQTKAHAAGAADILHKPFDLDELVQKTRKTLQSARS